jgi:hypothetical protein
MTDREMFIWFVVGTPIVVGFNIVLILCSEFLHGAF